MAQDDDSPTSPAIVNQPYEMSVPVAESLLSPDVSARLRRKACGASDHQCDYLEPPLARRHGGALGLGRTGDRMMQPHGALGGKSRMYEVIFIICTTPGFSDRVICGVFSQAMFYMEIHDFLT